MLKSALPWQIQGKKCQFFTNGMVLMLLLLGIFYFTSWNFLETSMLKQSPATDPIQAEPAPSSAQTSPPACPPPPSPVNCPLPTPPPSPYDPKKVAFLAESRALPHLPALFAHMTSIVPPEWTFKFMGSPEAITHMRSSPFIPRLEAAGKLNISLIPTNYSLSTRESISRMFTDPYLYSHHLFPAENLLVFQPDSIICANSPMSLNDYLEYDYIGAPWSDNAQYGGNGGLSYRRVSRILLALSKERRRDNDAELEDLWLSNRLNNLPGSKMANATISKRFSVESVWDEKPMGYHVGWLGVHHGQIWDNVEQVTHVLSYCPEVKIILGMKLSGDKPESVKEIERKKQEIEEKKKIEKEKQIEKDKQTEKEKATDKEKETDEKKEIEKKEED